MSAEARARLAARVEADYASGGHRVVFPSDLNDVARVGNEVADVGTVALAAQEAAATRAFEAAASAATALQARLQSESLVAAVTIGSTASLAYPSVVRNLVTASDVVDVCVYDTRLDSDGGAWTERCQHLPWYQEALNVANVRGAKRAFPKLAAIALRSETGATPNLMFYDALDLDPVSGAPRFWGAWTFAGVSATNTPSAVFALNGRVYVTSLGAEGSLRVFDFAAGNGWVDIGAATPAAITALSFSGLTTAPAPGSPALVSRDCGGVHARVLPGAPLGPLSGLPIPTVAVATGGGITVIHPDNWAVNITYADTPAAVLILSDGRIRWTRGTNNFVREVPLPYASRTETGATAYSETAAPALFGRGALTEGAAANVRSTLLGPIPPVLAFLAEDAGNAANGMVAYAAPNFATGWQPGNICIAAVCDGNLSAITAANIVANGDFTSDLSGWAGASASWSAGTAVITAPGGAADNRFSQAMSCIIGETYTVDVLTAVGGNARNFYIVPGSSNSPSDAIYNSGSVSAVSARFDFTATQTTMTFVARTNSTTAGQTFAIDSVAVRRSSADRSYKASGLTINGTLQRNAVAPGAELAAYSGFTSFNRMEQPYNAAMDFGTGDFCIILWSKCNDPTSGRTLLARSGASAAFTVATASSVWRVVCTGGGGNTTLNGTSLPTAEFQQIIFLRRNGVGELWVNGVLESSIANIRNVSGTDCVLVVGANAGKTVGWLGSIALLRIAGYAPTPAQIARMYADERALFAPGAAAFLGGTSGTITDLVYSEHTRCHAAATLDGVSVFSGLRRVEYLDGATTPLAIANDTMRAVGMEGGVIAFGSSVNAGVRRDAITGLDRMPAGPVSLSRLRRMRGSGVTTDATPLALAPRIHIGERETVVVEAAIAGRVYGASDSERLSYIRKATYYRQAGGNVVLQGSVQTIGTDTETTAGADATLAIDTTAQTVTPQVTGVAATRIVWSATLRVTRLSEQTQYEEVA